MPPERLQKIIAAAGVASRRKAEDLIRQGLVSVNGVTVSELGVKADLDCDRIKVGNKVLQRASSREYILMNKPKGFVTTVSDPEGRPTVMDLVRDIPERIYPVGRLDYASEGLLLLTNDGDLAHKLTHASSGVRKTYLIKVSGRPSEEELARIRTGVSIPMGRRPSERVEASAVSVKLIKDAENPWYELTLIEGRNRQIRKMFEEIGHHVEKIRRVRYGSLQLDVPPGTWRRLTAREIRDLMGSQTARNANQKGRPVKNRARTKPHSS